MKCSSEGSECEFPVFMPGGCCPQCLNCFHQNRKYANGERWVPSSDACQICLCLEGIVKCSEQKSCPNPKCSHGVVPQEGCCSPCIDCQYKNHIVSDGMQFSPPDDRCARCVCQKGNITCTRETCPSLLCRLTEVPVGACCPVCKGCRNDLGEMVEAGPTWIHPQDLCQVCSCKEGSRKCERIPCDSPCTHPVRSPDSCCPNCNGCQVSGRIYGLDEEIPSGDPCRTCFCYGGSMECESLRCPVVKCDTPETLAGHCCPFCKQCHFQGVSYANGDQFQPPSDPCYSCSCESGAVECEKREFCNPQCSEPVQLPGQCCPLCDGCEYEGNILKNQQLFNPSIQEPCLQCICNNGNVECFQQHCPPLTCQNRVKSSDQCCEECANLCFDGKISHEEGDIWVPSDDQCKTCTCKNSVPSCQEVDCAPTACFHPAAPFGVCCPECEHCEFTHRLYRNGQEFTHEDDPCQMCKCENGSVLCMTVLCDPLPCLHPQSVEEQCCPICPSDPQCHYMGRTYEAWETFLGSSDSCSECVCLEGKVSCHPVLCLETDCPNPQMGHCCDACDGCSYGDKNYLNHVSFDDPANPCRDCECESGVVACQQKHCEHVPCKSAIIMEGNCCPTCQDCLYKDQYYANTEIFVDPDDHCVTCYCQHPDVFCERQDCIQDDCYSPQNGNCCETCSEACDFYGDVFETGSTFLHPENPCEVCTCEAGEVTCSNQVCSESHCTESLSENCCSDCSQDCPFEGIHYAHQQVFPNPQNACEECVCLRGNVTCEHQSGPALDCEHSSPAGCCSTWANCVSNAGSLSHGSRVDPSALDSCETCTCVNGSLECQPKVCPTVHCANPVLEDCCPVCHLGCFYEGEVFLVGAEFDHPTDSCSECYCMDGSVHCALKPCDPSDCSNPVTDSSHCCPYCPEYCIYKGLRKENFDVFPDELDSCKECTCQNGDVSCSAITCPEVSCSHPAPGNCCQECLSCHLHGVTYSDGENWTNTNNSCETCLCLMGQVACQKSPCLQCSHPILSNIRCCPLCDGCFYGGLNYSNQERFIPLGSPPCEECICKNGSVTCHQLSCSLPLCSNPVLRPGDCCPLCQGCEVSGIYFDENEEFSHPENDCETCFCKNGMAACHKVLCPRNCTHPAPGSCCPSCDGCVFERTAYSNGATFEPDPCTSCICQDGSVVCTSKVCPQLACHLRLRLPGQCCETCRGCVYEGNEYENNATWISTSNPCLSCRCRGGTVSCQNVVCPVECTNPVPAPGLCCPVCPDCEQDGKRYRSGGLFSPSRHPCDSCTCDSGQIFCIRHECPTLLDCPSESIRLPREGECCPTCAGLGSTCNRDQIGRTFYPSTDPCFVCQCTDKFMWTCSKEFCLDLNCPVDQIRKSEKECCPKCQICISEGQDIYRSGDIWTLPNDPCKQCSCDFGQIKCHTLSCPPLLCAFGETEHLFPDECCPLCTSPEKLSCGSSGTLYENGQHWKPDPCTTCQCVKGKMVCHSERCFPLDCTSDEIPSVDPGQCCPECIPRPATCLAFGDPHYRTFDGAAISFQGTCRYILTADSAFQLFSIIVENNDRGFDGVSWTHRVVVALQNTSVDLRAGPTVYAKGKPVNHLPYFDDPYLYVEKTGASVLVTTNVGVKVLWNGDGYVEVTVSGVHRGKTCGLCGNFNNFPEDDMRTPNNQIVASEAEFGNSWKNRGAQPENCVDSVDIDPCSKGGYRVRKMANNKCSILKQSPFASCHLLIPPESYFAACVYDVCACSENDDCLCDVLSAYSQECAKAGVILDWRSDGLCGIHCAEAEGLVFDECGPPCPRTCENIDLPIGILAAQCFKPCVPGCQCSADKVLYNGRCVQPQHCP